MLELQNFLIKEQVAFLKTTDTYDIFDPDSGDNLMSFAVSLPSDRSDR